jgi:hypothetical protein
VLLAMVSPPRDHNQLSSTSTLCCGTNRSRPTESPQPQGAHSLIHSICNQICRARTLMVFESSQPKPQVPGNNNCPRLQHLECQASRAATKQTTSSSHPSAVARTIPGYRTSRGSLTWWSLMVSSPGKRSCLLFQAILTSDTRNKEDVCRAETRTLPLEQSPLSDVQDNGFGTLRPRTMSGPRSSPYALSTRWRPRISPLWSVWLRILCIWRRLATGSTPIHHEIPTFRATSHIVDTT